MQESNIWTEKYRPQTFFEIKGQEKIIARVKSFVEQKNMPHLLLAGPAGVGKSTLALVIAKELYGPSWKHNFLELNASDDRGIDVVRHTIKEFAKIKGLGNQPFKIIFLDECDSLTKEAQQALRRTMEKYVNTTRFILSCNYSSKIIDPIQSRCTVFRFKPLSEEQIKEYVNLIAQKEGLELGANVIFSLVNITNGDVRKVTNVLQSSSAISKTITTNLVYDLVSAAEPSQINEIIRLAINREFIKSREILLATMLKYGLSGIDILKQIQKETLHSKDIDEVKKIRLVDKCGEIEFRMVEGSDEYIQLEALLANYGI
jgi:replication factor C small subunit